MVLSVFAVYGNPECDSEDGFCEFVTDFDCDFGEENYLLKDATARTDFSFIATDWFNKRNDCLGEDVVYYGFYMHPDYADDSETSGKSKTRQMGQASGKCRGKNCPSKVQVSFPSKMYKDPCEGEDVNTKTLLEELNDGSESFMYLSTIKMDVFSDTVIYDEESNECDALWCSSEQRNVTRTVLESIGSLPKERSESLHECLWSGVRCRRSQVTSLQLIGNKGLTGSISEKVGLLTELEDLILINNAIVGSIPTQVGDLSFLHQLKLGNNNLDGTVPTELGELSSLRGIFLENNYLVGSFPLQVTSLPHLQSLYLTGNSFSIHPSLTCLTKDTDLDCSQIIPTQPPSSSTPFRAEGANFSSQEGTAKGNMGSVGSIDDGDWLMYKDLDFGPAGTTIVISLNHSKGNISSGNSRIEIRLDGIDGDLLATFIPNNTGGWDDFLTFSIFLKIDVEGVHDLYFVGKGQHGVLNLMWFELTNSVSFTVITEYKVDNNNAKDVQCSYEVLLEAFKDQFADTEEGFINFLGVHDEYEAKEAIRNVCTEAQNKINPVPFNQIIGDDDPQFIEIYFQGHGPWNEETETLFFPSNGDTPAQVLKESAAKVKEYYNISRDVPFQLPNLPQFDPSMCQSHVANCCWVRDRQANDNNGKCATPYDENCVDEIVKDNMDTCYNELRPSPYSNHINADGFTVFEEEGPMHCHGFAWANDEQETLSRYKGNALFFVSMYDHLYMRGYAESIPGSPMCGCVEHMPVSSRSDCTQTNVKERYTFSKRSYDNSLTGSLDEIIIKYQSCQGANNKDNDLEAYVEKLVSDGKLTTSEQDIFKTRLVGMNQCEESTENYIRNKGFERGFTIDKTKWTYVTGKGFEEEDKSLVPIHNARAFKEMIDSLEVPIVRRVCLDCLNTHENIYYRRLTSMPDDFDLLDTLTNNWSNEDNAFNVDFALYSTFIDAYFDTNRWKKCNFNGRLVGFPRHCGPEKLIKGQWNSFQSNRRHAFLLPANSDFVSQRTNIARGRPVRQINVANGGVPERAVDGNTSGVWKMESVTHTSKTLDPWWEVDLEHYATIDKLYIWNRIDCCKDRLANVQVDVYDEPYGNIVKTMTILGQLKQMNVLDMGGVYGQVVRITRKGSNYLSLAEVEIDGTLGPSPTASPTRSGLTNVALASKGAVAYQSETSHYGMATRAIDGSTDGMWQSGSVSHTPRMNKPSWCVALDMYYSISRIEVYNRVNCCSDRLKDFVVNIYRDDAKVFNGEPNTDVKVSYSIQIPYIVGNKVEISIPHSGRILSLAEVMVYGVEVDWDGPRNVALASKGAVAFHSKTAYSGFASRAIDGNNNGHWSGRSVTHTRPNMYSPFWEVQLNTFYNITHVEVFNRLDCCSERIQDFMLTIFKAGRGVYSVQANSDISDDYSFKIPGIIGDKVQVMLPGPRRTLSLAEVVVLGVEAEFDGPVLPDNIALASNGAEAFQSSTSHNGLASRAIDGNKYGDWASGSVSHTSAMANPYWEVTLGDYYNISRVDIYNRVDCCGDRLTNFVVTIYKGENNIYSATRDTREHFYTFDIPNVVCDKVQIMLPGNGRILSLAEVMIFGVKTEWDGPIYSNVALANNGAVASQTTTSHNGVASRAIDGNINGGYRDNSVTHTDKVTNPFWEVVLKQPYYIARVDVYNRVDCCSDRIRDFVVTIFNDGEKVFSEQASSDILAYYAFIIPNISGDKIRINLQGHNRILSLAEVKIIGTATAPGINSLVNEVHATKVSQSVYSSVINGKSKTNGTVDPPLYDDEYNSTDAEDFDPDDGDNDYDDKFEMEMYFYDDSVNDVAGINDDGVFNDSINSREELYSLDDTSVDDDDDIFTLFDQTTVASKNPTTVSKNPSNGPIPSTYPSESPSSTSRVPSCSWYLQTFRDMLASWIF